jgi:hypothetical protein
VILVGGGALRYAGERNCLTSASSRARAHRWQLAALLPDKERKALLRSGWKTLSIGGTLTSACGRVRAAIKGGRAQTCARPLPMAEAEAQTQIKH